MITAWLDAMNWSSSANVCLEPSPSETKSCGMPQIDYCPFGKEIDQAQRLHGLGLMVGEVVHDLSNMLSLALGHTEMASSELNRTTLPSTTNEHLHHVRQALLNCGDMCRDLLCYAGKSSSCQLVFSPSSVLLDLKKLLDVSISSNATFEMDIDEDLPALRGDPNRIRQIVLNLVFNASEALHGCKDGRIFLSVKQTSAPEGAVALSAAEQKIWLNLRVEDNGSGMDSETLNKIGTPFFTTKLTGRGLGLSAVKQLIRDMSGHLSVTSEVGKGSVFSVSIPGVCAGIPSAESEPVLSNKEIQGQEDWRGGTVLVVDDETELLSIHAAILKRIGLHVISANSGEAAVQAFYDNADKIGLVLLDMMMSHTSGGDVLQEIRSKRQNVPVVLISGCSENWIQEHLCEEEPNAVLTKPVSLDLLRNTVKRWYCLDTSVGAI